VIDLSRYLFEALRKDEEFILYRGRSQGDPRQAAFASRLRQATARPDSSEIQSAEGCRDDLSDEALAESEASCSRVLVLSPLTEHPRPESLKRLEHEYSLREALNLAWAARPIAIARYWNRTVLVLEDPGGMPFDQLVGQPLELTSWLHLAIGLTTAIDQLHRRSIIHKDIKPANVVVNSETGQCWLTGFGIASRLPRERQSPEPAELIAGTLAYMAPEQTGRMNRSIDSRSDLYALGVTLYQILTGSLPFTASEDPMEWVHCHIARQPIPPGERSKNVPAPVSAIIMKLLAKTAEERYQTAAGVERDLRNCLAQWETQRLIDEFPLAQEDVPDRLLIPEKLYGREREIDTLLASFDRVVASGRPEFVVVSGYSGIGKSSVVNELHKVLVPPRGLFASGKFDQYKRDIPYSTVAQAFQSLIRLLLGKSDAELSQWRDALREALDPNGQLMVDLVPELALILGKQPPVPELPPQDAQRRFHLVFRRLISVFARPEHPLALFLDDLQWLDAATLDLLEDVLRQPDVRHLMLIGAYRDNEVNSSHPLIRKLQEIRRAGAIVHEMVLAPLSCEDLGRLVADSLRYEPVRAAPFAHLVHQRTGGNPFFAIQFITALAEEELLRFDHTSRSWAWDVSGIGSKGYTDNVVDLMLEKLNRLPVQTQKALKAFACLGNSAQITTLSIVHGTSEEELHSDLWEALLLEFIVRLEGSYTFVHDRIHEAAYLLIPEGEQAKEHLRIGRLLVSSLADQEIEENVFDVVNQLNRGIPLITSPEERKHLAELNLAAGRRSISSTAYASARSYLSTAASLLDDTSWSHSYALAFGIELHRAQCEFLTGEPENANRRLTTLSHRARDTPDYSKAACLQIEVCTAMNHSDRAVEICLQYLRRVGIEWTMHPTKEQFSQEYDLFLQNLAGRPIEALIDLPPMDDPLQQATLNVLSAVGPSAFFTDENLLNLTLCRTANISVMYGNDESSPLAYTYLGSILGPHFGDYETGYRLGKLGIDLVERGFDRWKCRVYVCFGTLINPWSKHVRTSFDWIRPAFDAALEVGDIGYAGYCCQNLIPLLIANGTSLAEVHSEALKRLEFARKIKFSLVIDSLTGQLALIRQLRGLTLGFSSFDDAEFDEKAFERHLEGNPLLAFPACWYWIRKLQARFYAGDYSAALDAAAKAEPLLWTSPSFFEIAEYHFFSALSQTAVYPRSKQGERERRWKAIAAHQKQLAMWAKNCPANFGNRVALVAAEIARIEGRELDAERLYETAIRSAHENGFVHNEAMAHEIAAWFYAARGFKKIADAYLRDARYCYLRWGADGKVHQLDKLYLHLREEKLVPSPTSTIGAPLEHLDFGAVIKVSQAISGKIVLEKLIETLMRTAIEHAGAERGVLVLPAGSEHRIEAEATTSGDTIVVLLKEAANPTALPESIVHYVLRTQETVILDDASNQNSFSEDNYIRGHHARSILCMPLINQAKLIGVLYLENNLAPHVFTPARITVLRLLASQAAISLENTRLYRDLELREAKIRRLVDANIMGIVIFDLEGGIIEANEAFLRMLGYSRADLLSGRVRWTELTPAEWRQPDERALAEIATTGIFQPFEKEYFHHDGSRVPVMIGGAVFEGVGHEGVAFVLDLSEQKRAEEALRRSERYLSEAQRLSQTGSFGWDVTTGKFYWTQETFRIFEHDLRTEPTLELVLHRTHPADRSMVRELIDRVSHERKNFDFEHRLLMPDGSIKYLRVVGHPWVKDESGRFEFIGAVTDITERKLAEKALQEKEVRLRETQTELAHVGRVTTMGELAASIAHEVKQPLVGVITNASASLRFLTGDSPNLVETREAMHAIIRDGNRAADVVSRMRNLFKKAPPTKELLNINEAVEEVVILMRGEARRKRAALRTELAANLPSVMADRVQIQQVVMNLILNGLEAMNEVEDRERDLVIRTQRSEGDRVRVAVQDSGVGIDPLKVERIFDAFHTTKPGGMGMGLSISRSIVESHGGRLWATANDGPGATFQFTL